MAGETDQYYLTQPEPNKSCLLALRQIILSQDNNITESIKWSIPCFSFKKKMFCFLNIDKKLNEPYLLFVEGRNLNHPHLEIGNRTRMKIYRINPGEDIPIKDLKSLLAEALDFYKVE